MKRLERLFVAAGVAAALLGLAPLAARPTDASELAAAVVAANRAATVDINSAGEDQLRTLPGIGPARAQAIIAGRPYRDRDDLVKRSILPENIYDGIKDRIIVKQK